MATVVGTDGMNLFYNSDEGMVQSVPLLSSGASQFGSYLLSVSNGVTVAFNLKSGVQDIPSNTDAAVVIRAVIANMPAGGTIFFQDGVYNLNSLVQENTGGFSQYYAIGIPGGGSSQYASWNFIGESMTPIIDEFSAPVQTNGVVLNITPTAISSVSGSTVVMGIWARPDTVHHIGATVTLKNLDVRFPTNQRGNETNIDLSQALMTDLDHVVADFAITQESLQFPVAGTSGLYGITTTASSKQENTWRFTYALGHDIGFDIQSEHTILLNCYALNCNLAIDYGTRGGNIYHGSSWKCMGWGECARGLRLGANCQAGSLLEISCLDIEDAASGSFAPVYHATETTSGNSWGRISYTRILAGTGLSPLASLFDGAGGGNFTTVTYP